MSIQDKTISTVSNIYKQIINMNETIVTLDPGKYYKWQNIDSLQISLNNDPNKLNEYYFEFISSNGLTNLFLPAYIKIIRSQPLTNITKYIVKIIDDFCYIDSEMPTPNNYLTFVANGNQTISIKNYGSNNPNLEYSYDLLTWNTLSTTAISFGNDRYIFVRGMNTSGLSSSSSKYTKFVFGTSAKVNCFGNIMSLINYNDKVLTIPRSYCFYNLFYNCTQLLTAPELPATTLADYCYQYMFYGCTSLVTGPSSIPATSIPQWACDSMFRECNKLVYGPTTFSATSVGYRSCNCMFQNCYLLTSIPSILPATSLGEYCYNNMFRGCAALVTAPALPATTLKYYCYYGMFNGCTSLVTAPALPATTLAGTCYSYMFYGCTALNYIKALFLTTPSQTYTNNWVYNVAANGTFVKNANATWNVRGVNGIPTGWTVQTE